MQKDFFLNRLVGKFLNQNAISNSTIIGIRNNAEDITNDRMLISIQLFFDDYLLSIDNPIIIFPEDKKMDDFLGRRVIATNETQNAAEIIFDNGYKLTIDMRDEMYFGPEAMSLTGPNNFCAVWN